MGGLNLSKRRVFCKGCANLLYVGGRTKPMCVATAEFIHGPLRKRIDVEGVVSAETRNGSNDCGLYAFASMKAWELKRWLLWRLNDGVEEKRRAIKRNIEEYPISAEARSTKPKRGGSERYTLEAEEDIIEDSAEDEDALFVDRGAGGDEQSGTTDTDEGELLQDS